MTDSERQKVLQEVIDALEHGYHPLNPSPAHPADYISYAFKLEGHENIRPFPATERDSLREAGERLAEAVKRWKNYEPQGAWDSDEVAAEITDELLDAEKAWRSLTAGEKE